MIFYNQSGHQISLIWQLRGSVLPAAFAIATPASLLAIFMKLRFIQESVVMRDLGVRVSANQNFSLAVYGGFVSIVGFLVVFKCSQGLARFTKGLSAVADMNAHWYQACSALISFTETSTNPQQDVRRFQHLVVRLFSMISAAAMQSVADQKVQPFDILDNGTLNDECLELLEETGGNHGVDRVHVILHWIEHLVIQQIVAGENPGMLCHIPPPILARAIAQLGDGTRDFAEAMTITLVPLPFPYAQLVSFILLLHMPITACLSSIISINWFWSAVFTFISVATLWGINLVAAELQQPFQDDINDLPMSEMHARSNSSLALLLDRRLHQMPYLTQHKEVHNSDIENVVRAVTSVSTSPMDFKPNFKDLVHLTRTRQMKALALREVPGGRNCFTNMELMTKGAHRRSYSLGDDKFDLPSPRTRCDSGRSSRSLIAASEDQNLDNARLWSSKSGLDYFFATACESPQSPRSLAAVEEHESIIELEEQALPLCPLVLEPSLQGLASGGTSPQTIPPDIDSQEGLTGGLGVSYVNLPSPCAAALVL